jgi:hypothetical protein
MNDFVVTKVTLKSQRVIRNKVKKHKRILLFFILALFVIYVIVAYKLFV